MLKKTPLYDDHVKLNAKIVEFGGWWMPVQYTAVIDEHTATRSHAGLFDTCHMGEFEVSGQGSLEFLQRVTVNDVSKLTPGKAQYNIICNEKGGTVDDCFVYCLAPNEYMVVVNAGTIEKDFTWLQHHAPKEVTLKNMSDATAKLDIQGPAAQKILQQCTSHELSMIQRFHFVNGVVDGIPTLISRSGYTGEDGFELYFPATNASQIWNTLLHIGKPYGLKPCGLGARDTLRLESCYSLYGHELTEQITPVEAGIGWAVKENKPDFIGKSVLAQQKIQGPERIIAPFEMREHGIAREHYTVMSGEKMIGTVTSGTFSPTFKKSIGLALVERPYSSVGNELLIVIRDKTYKAMVVKRPFYMYREIKES